MSRFEKGSTDVSLARALAILRELDMTVDLRPRKQKASTSINAESMRRVTEAISASLPPMNLRGMETALNKVAALSPLHEMFTSNAAATFGPLAEYLDAHGALLTKQFSAPMEAAVKAMSENTLNPALPRAIDRDEESE